MPRRRKGGLDWQPSQNGAGSLVRKAEYCGYEIYLKLLDQAHRVILVPNRLEDANRMEVFSLSNWGQWLFGFTTIMR
jgi:hypothetical protein